MWCVLFLVALANANFRVIGGQNAVLGQFPWQVAIEINIGGGRLELCGGSIIAAKYILTAGHCMRDLNSGGTFQVRESEGTFSFFFRALLPRFLALKNPATISVLTGISRSSPVSRSSVIRFWVEPSYSNSFQVKDRIDLAILELTTALTFTGSVAAIPLCTTANNCGATGANLFVSGYGQTQSDVGSSVATILQFAPLLAVDITLCKQKFQANFNCGNNDCLPATNVCAQSNPIGGNKDSCFGDSGGPLSTTTSPARLWGVVSSGTVPAGQTPSCGKAGEYGVYVSVPPNLPWITSVTSGQQNTTAIDNACVASNTCSSFTPANPSTSFFPPFAWQWYYILAIALGGVLVLLLIILVPVCCCRK